jgi:hypothetical protein
MLMTTIVAVALGFAPVGKDGSVRPASDDYAGMVGPYSQTVGRDGKTHVRGFNRLTGAGYDLTIDGDGNVAGTVGAWDVAFRVAHAG